MIVTREWLKEWIDLDKISIDEICKSLNAIGLEVDSQEELCIPKGVKIGFVLSVEKHPDADKLNVCQVDLGDEVTQIVCGAKNVSKDQFVAVATIGTVLGDNFKIKKAILRGVESNGMICSSSEIGLPKMNDGIMVLDESIGELVLGKELGIYSLLNDDIIDIELTANRGDCLSIKGVARDLSAVLKREMKNPSVTFKEESKEVTEILKLEVANGVQSEIEHKFFEIKSLDLPLLYAFRLACVESGDENNLQSYLSYVTHSTGVLLRAYDFEKLSNKATLTLKQNSDGFDVVCFGDEVLSVVGINQNDKFKTKSISSSVIEASFIDPDLISQKKSESKIETDDLFYKSSRGSEVELGFGLEYLCSLIQNKNDLSIYSGSNKFEIKKEDKIIEIKHSFINNFIGQDIEADEIIQILNHLGFAVRMNEGLFIITTPLFRHDMFNSQDIIEELVRIIGIDNIKSSPLNFSEKRRLNLAYERYKKRNHFRQKSASIGFFESIHYFFDNKELMQKYNLDIVKSELDISNPITNELNTLRTTLILNLINSSRRNIKFGKKSVKLFEVGKVVDEFREEKNKIAFIFSGEKEAPSVSNHGKPETINFFEFAKQISMILGKIELQKSEEASSLISPYESARVLIDGCDAGYIARTHIKVEQEFDLPRTYICELDFDVLKHECIIASSYSKFPSLSRDLSLIIPKEIKFSTIREHLNFVLPKEVIGFAPMDIYESQELGDNQSVTVKFHLQSAEQTMQEEQILKIMDDILGSLKEKFGIGIR